MTYIPILMYHNIAPAPRGTRLSSLYVHPRSFAWQMKILALLGYKGLALSDLVPYLRGERQGRVVGLTFDDGYADNFSALPILKKHGFTATCYVVSGLIGKSNTWALGQGVKESSLMSKAEIKEWLAEGMAIGSHTHSHAHLCKIGPSLAKEEIEGSKASLEDSFGTSVTDFCYPYGEHNFETTRFVEAAGYNSAVTTHRMRATVGQGLLTLPRVHVSRRVTAPLFVAKLLTAYEDKRQEAEV